jgi:outer membrane protein OmpA-like peptidoglycan-associated protein
MALAGRLLFGLALAAAACRPVATSAPEAELQPEPAVDLLVRAFDSHPLVALSDGAGHGQPATHEFFARLVRDARFPRTARNIVVEFGNARYQSVMDRYISGEGVPRDQLRHAWEDTTQVSGTWSLPMYEQMFSEVRTVNATLPPSLRIRVLLGDPPIDWSSVTGPADEDMNDWRDAHFAHVVQHEVVNQGGKALLLIGGAHLSRTVTFPNSLIHLLDAGLPGGTWVVSVLDIGRIGAVARPRLQSWTAPAGASVRGTWLGQLDVREIGFDLSDGVVEDDVDAVVLLDTTAPHQQDMPALRPPYALELRRRRALADATLPFRGAKIRFAEHAAAFHRDSREPLEAVLRHLLRDRELKLMVKAFADATEPEPLALSIQRAAVLVDWLVEHGIGRDRLVARGCGASRPLTFGRTAADRAMNRRAELVRLSATAACSPPW